MAEEEGHTCEDGDLCNCILNASLKKQKSKGQAKSVKRIYQEQSGSDVLGTGALNDIDQHANDGHKSPSSVSIAKDGEQQTAHSDTSTVLRASLTDNQVDQNNYAIKDSTVTDLSKFDVTSSEKFSSEIECCIKTGPSKPVINVPLRNEQNAIKELHNFDITRLSSEDFDKSENCEEIKEDKFNRLEDMNNKERAMITDSVDLHVSNMKSQALVIRNTKRKGNTNKARAQNIVTDKNPTECSARKRKSNESQNSSILQFQRRYSRRLSDSSLICSAKLSSCSSGSLHNKQTRVGKESVSRQVEQAAKSTVKRKQMRNCTSKSKRKRSNPLPESSPDVSLITNTNCRFSERLKEALSSLDDAKCKKKSVKSVGTSSVENCLEGTEDDAGPQLSRNESSKELNSVKLISKPKPAIKKQKKSLQKKKPLLENRSVKARTCKRTKQEPSTNTNESVVSRNVEKLNLGMQQTRNRKMPTRISQSLTEESKDSDKFERLKQSLSDLDSFGLGGLAQNLKDIDKFINTLNDYDKKLDDAAAAYKPLKLKSSIKGKRKWCEVSNILKSNQNTKKLKANLSEPIINVSAEKQGKKTSGVSRNSMVTSTPKSNIFKGRRGPKQAKRKTCEGEPKTQPDFKTKQSKSSDDETFSAVTSVESKDSLPDQQFGQENDSLDFSLPSPKFEDENSLHYARSNSDSVSFDSNLAKDTCDSDDSDEELPVGLTPIRCEKTFSEKDIVWVKWKNWPYLPAMVKKVYKKKKRVSCLVFTTAEKPEKPWNVSISTVGKRIWHYFDDIKKEEIMKASEELDPDKKSLFTESMSNLDAFLTKKALGQIKDDFSFFEEDEELLVEQTTDSENDDRLQQVEREDFENDKNSSDVVVTGCIMPKGLSKRGELRKEKVREKTQKFTELLQSADCKKYLQGLFLEKKKSEKHTIFMTGTVKDKAKLKHQGYGPIDDESQIMNVLWTFYGWLKEVNKSEYLNVNDYIMDVWIPEGIVFVYKKFHGYGKKKAWEMFHKGPRRTKEEIQQMHDMIVAQTNNISPEDRQRYQEREEEVLKAAGILPDYKPKKLILR